MTTLPLFEIEEQQPAATGSILKGGVSRSGSLYGVHSYHTKIPPDAIEPYIAAYSRAGQIVMDPFCGSGMTGVAARRLGRDALLSDLSPAAVHIAENYTSRLDPQAFSDAAHRVLERCAEEISSLYATRCHSCGGDASTAYVIWSDRRSCPHCPNSFLVWSYRAQQLRRLSCTQCGAEFAKQDAPLLGEEPVQVNFKCRLCGRVTRSPNENDYALLNLEVGAIPYWYPRVPFGSDREMWRKGHADLKISSVADFYSVRNLWALAALWATIDQEPPERRETRALRFAFTAIANRASRRYQWNAKRPTNVLGGTLYVSSIRYEFNVLDLWKRKVEAVKRLASSGEEHRGRIKVQLASADALPVPDSTIDYVFTDPPFGANIVYSDCSLLWEAWLGALTDVQREAIVTRHRTRDAGGKGVAEYVEQMGRCFLEIARVLKPSGHATVVFQNTDTAVWEGILSVLADCGFVIKSAETLHKAQPSFKGVKADIEGERVAATDVVLTVSLGRSRGAPEKGELWRAVESALRSELTATHKPGSRLRSSGHLYAIALATAIGAGQTEPISFSHVLSWLDKNCVNQGGWRLKDVTPSRS